MILSAVLAENGAKAPVRHSSGASEAENSTSTPQNSLHGVGMVLRTQGSLEMTSSFFTSRPQGFVVKELMAGGSAKASGQVACGDVLLAVDGKQIAGLPLLQVQNLIRGPPSTTVSLTLVETEADGLGIFENFRREYTVELVRGDVHCNQATLHHGHEAPATPNGAMESQQPQMVFSKETFASAEGTQASGQSAVLTLDDQADITMAEDEAAIKNFWRGAHEDMTQLMNVEKDEQEWVTVTGWNEKQGLSVDTTSCLRDLRLISDVLEGAPVSSVEKEIVEDRAFLRDQVRLARVEMLEEKLEHQQEPSVSVSIPGPQVPGAANYSAPCGENENDDCKRCFRFFEHIQHFEMQRLNMQKAIVRHRVRAGVWHHERLKLHSKVWLQSAQIGSSLEQIVLELADIRQSFNRDEAFYLISNVAFGHKTSDHGRRVRASWNLTNVSDISLQERIGLHSESGSRRSLPLNNVLRRMFPTPQFAERAQQMNDQQGASKEDLARLEEAANRQSAFEISRDLRPMAADTNAVESTKTGLHVEMSEWEQPAQKAERENAVLKMELLQIAQLEMRLQEQDDEWGKDLALMETIDTKSRQNEHCSKVTRKVSELETRLEKMKEDTIQIQGLKEKYFAKCKDFDEVKKQKLNLEKELQTLKVEVKHMPVLNNKLAEKKEHSLVKQNASLETDLKLAKERVAELEKCIESTLLAVEADTRQRDVRHAEEIAAKELTVEEKEVYSTQVRRDLSTAIQERDEALEAKNAFEELLRRRTRELIKSEQEVNVLQDHVRVLNDEIDALQKQLERSANMLEHEKEENDKRTVRIKEMADELSQRDTWQRYKDLHEDEQRGKVLMQQRAIEAISSLRSMHKTEMSALKQRVAVITHHADDAAATVTHVHKEQTEKAQLKAQMWELDQQMHRLRTERDSLEAWSMRIQSDAEVSMHESDALKNKYEQMERASRALIAELETKVREQDAQWTKDVSLLKANMKMAKMEIYHLNQNLTAVQADKSLVESSLNRSAEEVKSCKSSIMILESAVKDAEEQRDEIRKAFHGAESVIKTLESEEANMRKAHEHSLQENQVVHIQLVQQEEQVEGLCATMVRLEHFFMDNERAFRQREEAFKQKVADNDIALAKSKEEGLRLGQQVVDIQRKMDSTVTVMEELQTHMQLQQTTHKVQINELLRKWQKEWEVKYAFELRALEEKYESSRAEIESMRIAQIRQLEIDYDAKLKALRDESERELRLSRYQNKQDMDEFKKECQRDKEAFLQTQGEVLTNLQVELQKSENKVLLKTQSCVALEEMLQRQAEEKSNLEQIWSKRLHESEKKWTSEVVALGEQIERLGVNAKVLEKENSVLKRTVEMSKTSLRGQFEQFTVFESEEKMYRSQRDAFQNTIKDLEAELSVSRDENAVLKSEILILQQDLHSVTSLNKELDEKFKVLHTERLVQGEQLEEVEQKRLKTETCCLQTIGGLKSQIATLESSNNELQQQLETAIQKRKTTQHELVCTVAALDRVKDQLHSVEGLLSAKRIAGMTVRRERDEALLACKKVEQEQENLRQMTRDLVLSLREAEHSAMFRMISQMDDLERQLQGIWEANQTQVEEFRSQRVAHMQLALQYTSALRDFASRERMLEEKIVEVEQAQAEQKREFDRRMESKEFQHNQNLQRAHQKIAQMEVLVQQEKIGRDADFKAFYEEGKKHLYDLQERDAVNDELKQALARSEEDCKSKTTAIANMEKKFRDLREMADTRIRTVADEGREVTMERDSLKESCGTLLADVDKLSASRDTLQRELDTCHSQLRACKAEVVGLKSHQQEQLMCYINLEKEASMTEKQLEEMRKESTSRMHSLAEAERLLTSHQQREMQLQSEILLLKEQLKAVEDHSRAESVQRGILESSCQQLQSDLEEANRATEKRQKVYAQLLTSRSASDVDPYGKDERPDDQGSGDTIPDLDRSLVRLISENSDYRRSESELRQQLAAFDSIVTLIEKRFAYLKISSFLHVCFLSWKLVCHSGQQISGFENVHCAEKDIVSEGSIEMKVPDVRSIPSLEMANRYQQQVLSLRSRPMTMTFSGAVHVRVRLRFLNSVILNWRLYMMQRLQILAIIRTVIERQNANIKRRAFQNLAHHKYYQREISAAGYALKRLVPHFLLQICIRRWLHEVDRSARHRMIMMQMEVRWTQASMKKTIACVRRNRTVSRDYRKLKAHLQKTNLEIILQSWWLLSRTQTIGAKFLRAGEKRMNRMTTVAVNVTGAAANVIAFVNPAVALGTFTGPSSSPADLNSQVHQNSSVLQSTDVCFEEERSDSNISTARSEPSPVKPDPETRHELPDPDTLFQDQDANSDHSVDDMLPLFDPGAHWCLSPSPP